MSINALAEAMGFGSEVVRARCFWRERHWQMGEVGQLDTSFVSPRVTNSIPGSHQGSLANVVPCQTTGGGTLVVVCENSVLENESGYAVHIGIVEALVQVDSAVPAGTPLVVDAANHRLTDDGGEGDKVVAIALEPIAQSSTGVLARCLLDGQAGIGTIA